MSIKTDIGKIATFDLETDPFKHDRLPVPFASDFFYKDHHCTTWGKNCVPDLIEHLKHFNGIAYAHNGGKFDFFFLLRFLPYNAIDRILVIGGRLVQMVFSWGLDMRDSYSLIPRPLREWAKEDIDISKLEAENREKYRDEIIRYLKKDTEYLFEMVDAFIREYGLHLTLASASFKILHKKFDVKHEKITERQDAKFRRWYFAGRVEFYELGEIAGPLTCVDINSSFPWSMTQDHWQGDQYITSCDLPKRHLEQSFLHVQAISSGCFPCRNEDGSVSFPADGKVREFFITGWEFVAAQELGLLYSCRILCAHTPIYVRNYSQFIDYFYKIKNYAESAGNKGERLFAKLLMNSGYGKFGIDPREHEEMKLCKWRESPGAEWLADKDDPDLGVTIYKRPAKNIAGKFNNVCIAASITGCSRALLMRGIHSCKGVKYCDTDSIIAISIAGLPISHRLGEWKIESVFDRLYIGGKKLYAGHHTPDEKGNEWKTASKGVKLTADQIIEVAKGKEITYVFEAPTFTLKKTADKTAWHRFTKRKIRRADQMNKAI